MILKEIIDDLEKEHIKNKIFMEVNFRVARSYSLAGKMDAKTLSMAQSAVDLASQRLQALREIKKEFEENKLEL